MRKQFINSYGLDNEKEFTELDQKFLSQQNLKVFNEFVNEYSLNNGKSR